MTTLIKFPEETRTYAFDFAAQRELAVGGDSLSASPTPPAVTKTRITGNQTDSLVIGTPSVVQTRVEFQISGGLDLEVYQLVCTVRTTAGATLAAIGELKVMRQ